MRLFIKRVLGCLYAAICFASMLSITSNFLAYVTSCIIIQVHIFDNVFLLVFSFLFSCVLLYQSAPSVWLRIHERRNFMPYGMIPDIYILVDFIEYLGDTL